MSQQDQDAEGFMLRATEVADVEAHPDLALGVYARKIYQSRRERDKKSPAQGLFQDPAWDILLDLFIAHAENKKMSVTSAGLAGQASTTTALRWIWALEEAKLVERKHDEADKRRSFVSLTTEGLNYMRDILSDTRNRLGSTSTETCD